MTSDVVEVNSPASTYNYVLPATIVSKSGHVIQTRRLNWRYRYGPHRIHLDFKSLQLTSDALRPLKATIAWYIENKSGQYVGNLFNAFKGYVEYCRAKKLPVIDVSKANLVAYRSSLNVRAEWKFANLRILIEKGHSLGRAPQPREVLEYLQPLRIKGNPKGESVRTLNPTTGPFSELEFNSLTTALNIAYARGQVELDDYLLSWLYLVFGQRSVQYASMKVCDVLPPKPNHDGVLGFSVNIPRAKQRKGYFRDEFRERPLAWEIGELLDVYAQVVATLFEGVLEDPKQAPLFSAGEPGPEELFLYHASSDALGERFTRVCSSLGVISERTGKPLHVFPTRCRRALGTRLAEEGHGPRVIAEALDHSDTQSVKVYSGITPLILERLDRAVAMRMAPLAQAFVGTLIPTEKEATRGSDPSSRIIDLRIDRSGKNFGWCGKHGFCGFAAPIACYTCISFEPWLDGPHEAVLVWLLKKRSELRVTSDKRIAAINDRTIFAVAEVIRRCEIQQSNSKVANG